MDSRDQWLLLYLEHKELVATIGENWNIISLFHETKLVNCILLYSVDCINDTIYLYNIREKNSRTWRKNL